MRIMTPYTASLRRFTDTIWSVVRLAWHEDWRLVTSRGILKAFSAGIPAAQAYIAKLLFDTLSAGYGSDDSRVWRTAIGYLLLELLLLAVRTALQSAGRSTSRSATTRARRRARHCTLALSVGTRATGGSGRASWVRLTSSRSMEKPSGWKSSAPMRTV
jgi:hypothetical protein